MAIVGVVPAAGYATRLQPLELSKEMLEVGGRPVIDYLVERMRVGGGEDVRIVTRPEKEDVVSYANAAATSLVLAYPKHINASFAAGMTALEREDIVLLGFPDSLWEPLDGFARLVETVQEGCEVALGLFHAPGLSGSDFVTLDGSGRITGFHIKPRTPPSDWIWGCAAARAGALEGLEREEWPSAFMESRRRRGLDVVGVPLSDSYLDIGTPESLRVLSESQWMRSS